MLDGTLLIGFVATALVVLLLPGPGVVYVVARSVGQGYRAGLVSAVGLSAGALVHVVAAAVGLSAILLASATAFGVVKALGAAYLVYLGLRELFSRRRAAGLAPLPPAPLHRLFFDGVVVSVFNPKIAIFFLAFLPQFVDPALGQISLQVLLLGLIYVLLAVLTDGGYALLAGGLRQWLTGRFASGPWPRFMTGGVYIGLGVHAALAERPR